MEAAMKHPRIRVLALLCGLTLLAATAHAGAPQVVWEAPTPNSLANSIQGVGWAPGTLNRIAVGSTDRWVRTRVASNGALLYSVLQPIRSGSANQTVYSTDGAYLAVHNSGGGMGYRIHRASDGVFLGRLEVTVLPNGLLRFAPDAQLLAAVGGDGTLSKWRGAEFTVVRVTGSGYDTVTTTYNFSFNNAYQAAASQGTVTIQARGTGNTVRILTAGNLKGVTPMQFTPDSTRLAVWSSQPNRTTLWRVSDGVALKTYPGAASNEGVAAIRFTADGARLVTTGYLPFQTPNGWDQKGVIRFWRVSDGVLRTTYDARTGLAVTSPIAWMPGGSRFAYGTYQGAVVVALTPAP
jgi:WD40 repeat protein